MTEQGRSDLTGALSTIAAELQRVCIVKTGMNRVQCSINDKRQWHGPALKSNLNFAGVALNDLPRFLYAPSPRVIPDRMQVWDQAVGEMVERRSVAARAALYFPTVTFSGDAKGALVQLLCCLWWEGGKLDVTQGHAFLNVGTRIGLDERVVILGERQHRLPRSAKVNPTFLLASPHGKRKTATPETTALFRHLMTVMPESAAELDVIFSTAITAGRDFEALLTDQFHVNHVEDIELPTATVWATARSIVVEAVETPNERLWTLLKGTVPYHTFTKEFGVPRERNTRYSPALRRRHLDSIERFENGEIETTFKKKTGDSAAAANSLLNLQQLMGSWK